MYTLPQISAMVAVKRVLTTPVGMSFSSILIHKTLGSSPGCVPTYTMPDICFRSGPAVVENLAEREPSGNNEFRNAPSPTAAEVCSSPFCSPS